MNNQEHPLINDQMVLGGYRVMEKLDVNSKNSLYVVENESDTINNDDDEQSNYYNKLIIMKAMPYHTSEEKYYFNQELSIINILKNSELFITYDGNFEEEVDVEYIDESGKVCKCKKNYMFALMKYYKYNDLEKELNLCGKGICNETVIDILFQVLNALKFLKDNDIVHHDIKLSNIMIISTNPLRVALTDFEFAEFLSDDQKTISDIGTPTYMSPEILKKIEHRMEVDMWALGIAAYRLLSKGYPFNLIRGDSIEKARAKIENKKLSFPRCLFRNKSALLTDLIARMLEKDQDKRIGVDEALQNELFECYYMDKQENAEIASNTDAHI